MSPPLLLLLLCLPASKNASTIKLRLGFALRVVLLQTTMKYRAAAPSSPTRPPAQTQRSMGKKEGTALAAAECSLQQRHHHATIHEPQKRTAGRHTSVLPLSWIKRSTAHTLNA